MADLPQNLVVTKEKKKEKERKKETEKKKGQEKKEKEKKKERPENMNSIAFCDGPRTKYPVIVYIHGESYEWNSGNVYDGTVLASYGGVVVVTVNYRLGILGFLNVNTDVYLRSPANYGLMDQIAALHWIQENVAFFNGDPTNVTLVGHGTGAACVNFLMASSAVPDGLLFHRAILMSGSALSPWALVREPYRFGRQVARHADCAPDMPQAHLLRCLRDRPLARLMSAPIQAPEFAAAFGPSVDGVVIDSGLPEKRPQSQQDMLHNAFPGQPGLQRSSSSSSSSSSSQSSSSSHDQHQVHGGMSTAQARKNMLAKISRYDLLLGVVKAEAFLSFTGDDVTYGIETDRRTRILRTYVKNTYKYHLSEILATIVNEYTDWERPVQHPINIRDETLEALSDASTVAPVVHTADMHATSNRQTYLYVFDYQTKFGDYNQRLGCVHGEELPYMFGAALVGGLMHFPRNYTKSEMLLAEATMIYWSNFARSGNPNEPQDTEPVHGIRQEKNKFKNIEWSPYESLHKKYLSLDTKPKVKNHYRAHRLSFWLNLVPDLHRPGGDDVPRSHHQLDNLDDYPQHVQTTTSKRPPDTTPSHSSAVGGGVGGGGGLSPSTNFDNSSLGVFLPPVVVVAPSSADRSGGVHLGEEGQASSQAQDDGFAAYSTALSVTIAIGCSLLILNVLIFAGVYYQRDKTRHHHHHHSHEGGGGVGSGGSAASINSNGSSNGGTLKKRQENGGPMSNICVTGGATELLQIMETRTASNVSSILKSDPTLLVLQPPHHHPHTLHPHHRQPPPEFADPGAVPKPPPPPKTQKPPELKTAETQPLLPPPHGSIQLINTNPGGGTLTRKQVKTMDELRV